MTRPKKRKMKKPRNMIVLGMILACKGKAMKDRREERGGDRNRQRDYLSEADA